MSQQPRNAFYQNLATIEVGQQTLDDSLGELKAALPSNSGVEAQIGQLGASLARSAEIQAELTAVQVRVAEAHALAAGRIAEATERLGDVLATQLVPSRDAPAAYLYLGVDVDGSFNQASHLGRFLIEVCGEKRPGLAWLSPGRVRKPEFLDREAFIANGRRVLEQYPLLQANLTDYDLGRFHDLAPHVLRFAEARPAAEPSESS